MGLRRFRWSPAFFKAHAGIPPSLNDYMWTLWLEAENASRHIMTAYDSAQLNGNGTLVCNPGRIETNATSDANFTNDFTMQTYITPQTGFNDDLAGIFEAEIGETNRWHLYVLTDGRMAFYVERGNVFEINLESVALTWTIGTEYHVAVTRSGNDFKLFRDGVIVDSSTTAVTFPSLGATAIEIGRFKRTGFTDTHIYADYRLTSMSHGIARWTADFSSNLPTELTVDEYTILALNYEGAEGIADSSDSQHTVRLYDDANIVDRVLNLDGSDYVDLPDSSDWDVDDDDFTAECWINPTNAAGGIGYIMSAGSGATVAQESWSFRVETNNTISCLIYSSSFGYNITSVGSVPDDTWSHVALTRQGGTMRCYVNGIQVGTSSVSSAVIGNQAAPFTIGGTYEVHLGTTGARFNGKIARVHITKNLCRYPDGTSFTPESRTSDITTDSNSVLALNFNGSDNATRIIDDAKPSYAITVGDTFEDNNFNTRRWNVTEGTAPQVSSGLVSWLNVNGNRTIATRPTLAYSEDFTQEVDWSWDNIFSPSSSIAIGTDALMASGGACDIFYQKTSSTTQYVIRVNSSQTIYNTDVADLTTDKVRWRRTGTTLYAERWNGSAWITMASGTNSSDYTGITLKTYNDDGSPTFNAHFEEAILNGSNETLYVNTDTGETPIIPDISTNENDITQTDSSKQPLYKPSNEITTLAVESFDGINDSMSVANANLTNMDFGTDTFVIFAIVRRTVTSRTETIIEKYDLTGGNEDGFLLNMSATGLVFFECSDGSGTRSYAASTNEIDDGNIKLITAIRDGSTGLRLRINGTEEVFSSSQNPTSVLDVTNTFDLEMGDGSDPGIEGNYWSDNIGGILIRDTLDSMETIESILMNKYGIS